MHLASQEVESLWYAALADAGIDDRDAALFAIPGSQSPGGDSGKTWPRHVLIDGDEERDALGDRVETANSDAIKLLRRVAVWTDRTPEGLAAVLRHELEHSLQYDEHGGGELVRLHQDAADVLIEIAGGLPGSAVLYNEIPIEVDARGCIRIRTASFRLCPHRRAHRSRRPRHRAVPTGRAF